MGEACKVVLEIEFTRTMGSSYRKNIINMITRPVTF